MSLLLHKVNMTVPWVLMVLNFSAQSGFSNFHAFATPFFPGKVAFKDSRTFTYFSCSFSNLAAFIPNFLDCVAFLGADVCQDGLCWESYAGPPCWLDFQ